MRVKAGLVGTQGTERGTGGWPVATDKVTEGFVDMRRYKLNGGRKSREACSWPLGRGARGEGGFALIAMAADDFQRYVVPLRPQPNPCVPATPPSRVATALVLLAVSPPAPWSPRFMTAPVVLIICREITMSALREWAAAAGGGADKVGPGPGVIDPHLPHALPDLEFLSLPGS